MVVAKVKTGAPVGFRGHLIEVESDTTKNLPSIQIVGLANKSIDEAKERVKSALLNSLLEYPARKITINLAPAELPKEGTHYDLPIAIAILVSSGQIRQSEIDDGLFAGELALDGTLRPIKGAITIAETAQKAGVSTLYLPVENAPQAGLIKNIEVIGVSSLKDLFLHLKKEQVISPTVLRDALPTAREIKTPHLDDIYGQEQAKRALVIAAAGRHNILFNGSPGAGKTMLARTLTNLLPALSDEERIAVTKLHSLTGESIDTIVDRRPFRSPHHTSSRIALIGGGSKPQPGEISLAHLGVLFLDELPEYPRATLEALRQPLEDRTVSVARVNGRVEYPADFMLVGTMNPCPCGYYGDTTRECTCTAVQISHYQRKLSGPLLDRIDLVVNVSPVPHDSFLSANPSLKKQHNQAIHGIQSALSIQRNRYNSSVKYNASLSNEETKRHVPLASDVRTLLGAATQKLGLSARSYFKLIRIARTIADLEGSDAITTLHISEALQYRRKTLD